MNKILVMAFVIALASCKSNTTTTATGSVLSAQDEQALIRNEITHWELAKLKNIGNFRNQLAPDYIGYFGTHTLNADGTAEIFKKVQVQSYRLSQIKVKGLSSDAAIVYYVLNRNVTDPEGNAWVADVAASSAYAKRNGKWMIVYYQETEM